MWMRAGQSMVRRALRRIFPMTHACSQLKCAKVKDFSSRARSEREFVGEGRELSIVKAVEGAKQYGRYDEWWGRVSVCKCKCRQYVQAAEGEDRQKAALYKRGEGRVIYLFYESSGSDGEDIWSTWCDAAGRLITVPTATACRSCPWRLKTRGTSLLGGGLFSRVKTCS